MQLCLNEDDCETDVLGETLRTSFAFSEVFLSLSFSCILSIFHVDRTCDYLVKKSSFQYLFFLAILNSIVTIFDSILDFSAFISCSH